MKPHWIANMPRCPILNTQRLRGTSVSLRNSSSERVFWALQPRRDHFSAERWDPHVGLPEPSQSTALAAHNSGHALGTLWGK